jgi:hypothetical protein
VPSVLQVARIKLSPLDPTARRLGNPLHQEAYLLRLLHYLNMCHLHPWPPNHQYLLSLHLTWSTRSTPPHVLLLIDFPKCQPPTVSLLPTLVPHSKPHVHPSPLLVRQHSMSPHLLTNIAKRHVARTLMLGLVSNSTEAWSSPDNHSSQLSTYGHISTMCSQGASTRIRGKHELLDTSKNNRCYKEFASLSHLSFHILFSYLGCVLFFLV